MKVSHTKGTPPKTFTPFVLHLNVETEDEATRLFAVFNCCSINAIAGKPGISEEIKAAMGRLPDYNHYHNKLCGLLR